MRATEGVSLFFKPTSLQFFILFLSIKVKLTGINGTHLICLSFDTFDPLL